MSKGSIEKIESGIITIVFDDNSTTEIDLNILNTLKPGMVIEKNGDSIKILEDETEMRRDSINRLKNTIIRRAKREE